MMNATARTHLPQHVPCSPFTMQMKPVDTAINVFTAKLAGTGTLSAHSPTSNAKALDDVSYCSPMAPFTAPAHGKAGLETTTPYTPTKPSANKAMMTIRAITAPLDLKARAFDFQTPSNTLPTRLLMPMPPLPAWKSP